MGDCLDAPKDSLGDRIDIAVPDGDGDGVIVSIDHIVERSVKRRPDQHPDE